MGFVRVESYDGEFGQVRGRQLRAVLVGKSTYLASYLDVSVAYKVVTTNAERCFAIATEVRDETIRRTVREALETIYAEDDLESRNPLSI